ncbi:MAG: glycosyltransferase family 2 protein [bacterium]|nr:glycosyltransferase family 2 protein [bacterium]
MLHPELSVVVPVYEEALVLAELHRRLVAALDGCTGRWEIVYVDDGSHDASPLVLGGVVANDARVRVLRFSRNFGHQAAVTAGLEHAMGEAVITIDGDLQDPPELIPELVARWRDGFQVVSAVRTVREGESPVRLVLIRAFYRLLGALASLPLTPDSGDYRLLDRRVVDVLCRLPERHRYVRGLAQWVGFRQCTVAYRRQPRFAGQTKYPYRKLVGLALDGITSFSTAPLRFATYMGFALSLASLALILFALWAKLILGTGPQGWASVVLAVGLLSGAQLLALGIIGLYVGRILDEVRGRPLYVLADDDPNAARRPPQSMAPSTSSAPPVSAPPATRPGGR